MFGGTHTQTGLEKFNGSQRELLMAVSRGQNGSAQDGRREKYHGISDQRKGGCCSLRAGEVRKTKLEFAKLEA